MRRMAVFFSGILLILTPAVPQGHAGVVHVEKWGQDSTYCGSAKDPCATIGRAIENADPGNTVLVGPGIYGDINGDGDFEDSGEESSRCGLTDSVVCVNKANLRLESTMGAVHTVIDGGGSIEAGVCLAGNRVSFGKKGRGFTVRYAKRGVVLEGDRITVQSIRAEDNTTDGFFGTQSSEEGHYVLIGNTAVRDLTGFYFRARRNTPYLVRFMENRGRDNTSYGVYLRLENTVTVRNNVMSNNNGGFLLSVGGGSLVKNNLAVGNAGVGFSVTKRKSGSVSLIGNSAARNGSYGFHLTSIDKFLGNVSTDNDEGLYCRTVKMRIVNNSITENASYGITIHRNGPGTAGIVLQKNNIYGNGWDTGDNCGLRNNMTEAITVRKNFWGDRAGPGADPADDTCGDPVTETSPARKPLKVKVKTAIF